jgi:hypothetical protein
MIETIRFSETSALLVIANVPSSVITSELLDIANVILSPLIPSALMMEALCSFERLF